MTSLFKTSSLAGLTLAATFALPAQAAIKVLACEPEWGALATELGGDLVDVGVATTAMQ
jgi:zinc/manganese transport system substrate-binding protein